MFLIVGLGNPGKKYEKTRHNAGFMAVDFLLAKNSHLNSHLNGHFKENKKLKSLIAETEINNQKVILTKPLTYMNNSGQAVQTLAKYYKIKPNNIIIIYDEIDLPFGEVRVRDKGSSAGHNGIKSIISHLGTENFWRIRIGIKNDKAEKIPADKFVLKKFSRGELKELDKKILPQIPDLIFGILGNKL